MCLDASSTVFLALFVIWLASGCVRTGRLARVPSKALALGLLLSLTLTLAGMSGAAMAQEAAPESPAQETAASDATAKADEGMPAAAEEPDPTEPDSEPESTDAEPTEEADADRAAGAIADESAAEEDEQKKSWRNNGKIMLAVAMAVLVIPFALSSFLASTWRVREYQGKMTVIFLTIFAGLAITIMGWPPKFGIDLRGGVILVYELADEIQEDQGDQDPDQMGDEGQREDVNMENLIAAITRRVNPGGVKEITIRRAGVGQVEIIVPEVEESEVERLKRIISDIGTLEFRILANQRDHGPEIERALQPENANKYKIYDEQKNLVAWWVPVTKDRDDKFGHNETVQRPGKTEGGYQFTEILVINDSWNVNGGYLVGAKPGMDDTGGVCVDFHFNSQGGRLFAGLTGDNTPDKVLDFRRALGIVLSGYLFSAPTIESTIHERGTISGGFTNQTAEELVSVLNAGSLPTALNTEPASQMASGPTLGKDTIERGQNAIMGSMLLVLVFMVFYYRFAGVVACFAMITNLVLLLAIMITVNAAFTLPGLAGLVLTVGMAVDANVLIFERIREELDRQATLRMAIRNGFKRATTTIVDANLTTLITGVVLYWIGTDQVKGFAVTLILGVTLSMYTAIFCSRVIFDIAEKKRWITRLKMLRIIGGTKIDFLGKRRLAAAVSLVIICLGLVAVVHRGKGLLDIDFTGGVSIQAKFNERQDIGEIRTRFKPVLDDLAVSDVQISNEPENLRFVINTSSPPGIDAEEHLENVKKIIGEAYGPQLEHYTMRWEVEGDEAAEPQESQPPAVEAAPQTRADLPSDNLLASADPSAVILARAEPPDPETPKQADAESKPAEATADKPLAGPAAPVLGPAKPTPPEPEKPASAEPSMEKPPVEPSGNETPPAKEDAPSTGPVGEYQTRAKIDFGSHKMSRNALSERLDAQMEKLGTVERFGLSNEEYDKAGDAEKAHPKWTLLIDLSVEETKTLLATISTELESQPYFPASNTIGGKVAGNMRVMAILALLTSLVFIVGYIWIRFQKVMFGLAAVVALVHDVLITLGVIALSAYVANALSFLGIVEFKIGLSVLAAFLTIIGYSLNDTIVVFDRIREVRGKSPELTEKMINLSINQTLARTLLTSVTTLIVVVILYIWGGQGIHAFSFSLVIGVLVGTYSSIFVASPVLLWMAKSAAGPRQNGAS
jgi:SecD/SecF fusion protein